MKVPVSRAIILVDPLHAFVFVVPVVTLVLEGGKDTIANIYYDLRTDIPVVIIDVSE